MFELFNFINIYNVKQEGNSLILYKSVNESLYDFWTGKIKYKIGEWIKAPDWNPDNKKECGGGLHVCSSIEFCKEFNTGRYLKVKVPIKDIVIHPSPSMPHKIRCKRLFVIEEVFDK